MSLLKGCPVIDDIVCHSETAVVWYIDRFSYQFLATEEVRQAPPWRKSGASSLSRTSHSTAYILRYRLTSCGARSYGICKIAPY
eukprot:scaffold2984_cov452-Prasinococcus_capsulatus_cf.AAC.12